MTPDVDAIGAQEEGPDVMSDEDREQLASLQRRVDDLTEQRKAALEERNGFMNTLFNTWRADIHEIARVIRMRRQNVHVICRGPRTGSRRPLSSRRWHKGGES